MPIDPSIILATKTAQIANPIDSMAKIAQVRQMQENQQALVQERQARASLIQQQEQQRRQAMQDQSSLDSAMQPGATREDVLAKLPGHMHAAVTKQWQEADEADAKVKKAKQDAANAEAEYFGGLAASVKAWGYDPQAAQIALQHAKDAGHDTSQIEQILQQKPDALQQVVDGLIQASPKHAKEAETARKNQMAEFMTATTAANTANDKRADNARQDARDKEIARHNQEMEKATLARAKNPAGSGTTDDADAIADAIASGDQPPLLTGLYRLAGPVRASLAKRGYNLTDATTDWNATQKHIATLNGSQQTRLRQAVETASHSLDVIDDLAGKWMGGSFPVLNRVNLAAAKNGVYGPEAQSIATQLNAQITDLTSELGNVYMGGNSPTDHALKLAGENLRADWSEAVLKDMTKLARTNLSIRANSMKNVGVAGAGKDNPYAQPDADTKAPEEWVRGADGKLKKKGS